MKFCGEDYDVMKLMKAADEGDVDAMRIFITLCYSSDDRELYERTKDKWFEYVKKMAVAGDAIGYIWMADAFSRGELVEKDVKRAIEFYLKAADEGISFGYECIGDLYFKGNGVPVDYEKAYKYIMKSRKKSGMSFYLLGEMYRQGLYVKQNMSRARQYYRRAIGDGKYPEYKDMYAEFAEERLKGNYEELKGEYED